MKLVSSRLKQVAEGPVFVRKTQTTTHILLNLLCCCKRRPLTCKADVEDDGGLPAVGRCSTQEPLVLDRLADLWWQERVPRALHSVHQHSCQCQQLNKLLKKSSRTSSLKYRHSCVKYLTRKPYSIFCGVSPLRAWLAPRLDQVTKTEIV